MIGRQYTEGYLKDSEERFRLTFDNARVGIAIVDLDYLIQQVNPSLSRLLGYSQSELLLHSLLDLTYPDDVERDLEMVRQVKSGELERYQSEKRYTSKSGSIIWVKQSVILVRDSLGTAAYALAMMEDITEQRHIIDVLIRAEEEADKHIAEQTRQLVRSSAASTRAISRDQTEAAIQRDQLLLKTFHSLSSHVVALDRKGTITYANKSWKRFSGEVQPVLMCDTVGLNYLEVCSQTGEENDLFAREALTGIRAVMAGNLPEFTLEYPFNSAKEHCWFLMKVDPMPYDYGGVVISYTDITGRKMAEESLHDLLLEVERLKDQLQAENLYLREEVRLAREFGEIIG